MCSCPGDSGRPVSDLPVAWLTSGVRGHRAKEKRLFSGGVQGGPMCLRVSACGGLRAQSPAGRVISQGQACPPTSRVGLCGRSLSYSTILCHSLIWIRPLTASAPLLAIPHALWLLPPVSGTLFQVSCSFPGNAQEAAFLPGAGSGRLPGGGDLEGKRQAGREELTKEGRRPDTVRPRWPPTPHWKRTCLF